VRLLDLFCGRFRKDVVPLACKFSCLSVCDMSGKESKSCAVCDFPFCCSMNRSLRIVVCGQLLKPWLLHMTGRSWVVPAIASADGQVCCQDSSFCGCIRFVLQDFSCGIASYSAGRFFSRIPQSSADGSNRAIGSKSGSHIDGSLGQLSELIVSGRIVPCAGVYSNYA